MGADLRTLVRPLFATRPDEFVAARNALAKRLRADGERDLATEVAALRRPSWPDHVLDLAVERHPDLVTAFLDSAAVTREIQDAAVAGRRTGSLPDALRELRAAQTALAGAANRLLVELGRGADPAGIGDRLGEVAADADTAAQLRDGILGAGEAMGAGADPTGADPTPAGPTTARTKAAPKTKRRTSSTGRSRGATEADPGAAERAQEAEREAEAARSAARAEREALQQARREAVRLAATADQAVRRAAQRRDRGAASVTDAERAVAEAQEALDRARSVLEGLDEELAATESTAEELHGRAAELDEQLDALRREAAGS